MLCHLPKVTALLGSMVVLALVGTAARPVADTHASVMPGVRVVYDCLGQLLDTRARNHTLIQSHLLKVWLFQLTLVVFKHQV